MLKEEPDKWNSKHIINQSEKEKQKMQSKNSEDWKIDALLKRKMRRRETIVNWKPINLTKAVGNHKGELMFWVWKFKMRNSKPFDK